MSRIRALVVDDEPMARDRVLALLQQEPDVEVIGECQDGTQAVAAIHDKSPDLVFLDVHMPGVDGLEAAGELLYPRSDVHVVLMSANGDEPVRRAAAHIGVEYFLKKPFRPAEADAILHALYGLTETRFQTVAEKEIFIDPDVVGPTTRIGIDTAL